MLPHAPPLTLSPSPTPTHPLQLTLTHPHTHTHCLTLPHTHTHTHTHMYILLLLILHTHAHTHTLSDIPNDETFRVRLRKSNSLMFSGPCLLEILRDFDRNIFHIAIFTEDEPPRLIVKWQIDHVRQYGSNRMAFKFQSGRWRYCLLCTCTV